MATRDGGVSNCFTLTFIAEPEHIDDMGHVNNAVWVQWMEAVATAHWKASAAPQHLQAYAWVVTRHEIDYRGNVALGESVMAQTMLPDGPKGARSSAAWTFETLSGKRSCRHGRPGR